MDEKFKAYGIDVEIQTKIIDELSRKPFAEIVQELKNKKQKVYKHMQILLKKIYIYNYMKILRTVVNTPT